jgi:UDP-glucose 4-epimerase
MIVSSYFVVSARAALERAPKIGFGRYVVSATRPFEVRHLAELAHDAVIAVRAVPGLRSSLRRMAGDSFPRSTASMSTSALAREVWSKGHDTLFADGSYPIVS